MNQRHVGRFEAVGQDPRSHAAPSQRGELRRPLRSRHEVCRNQIDRLVRRLQKVRQPRDHQVANVGVAQGFRRIVTDEADRRPFECQRAIEKAGHEAGRPQRGAVGLELLGVRPSGQRFVEHAQTGLVARDDRFDRIGRGARPVGIEVGRYLRHHRAHGEHVEVEKRAVRTGIEIFIADVSAADHRGGVVDGEALVVHAMVEAEEVEKVIQRLRISQHERIEQAHFHVGKRVQGSELRVHSTDAIVVDQQPHPHAAFGRGAERIQKQRTGQVVVPDVILGIDR